MSLFYVQPFIRNLLSTKVFYGTLLSDLRNCRICLYGTISFGAANVVICRLIAPPLDKMMGLVGSDILCALSFLLAAAFFIDITATLIYRKKLNQNICLHYEKIHRKIDQRLKKTSEFLSRKEIPNFALAALSHRKL